MTPLWTIGEFTVTPYSLMILLGALAGTALSLRKKHIRPLLPAVILGALILGHAVWVLFCPFDLEAVEGRGYMLLRPWQGGYTLYGALLGGALGALIAGKLSGVKWLDVLDALAPGACAVLFFARIGEYFTGDWTHFFPLSVCTYHDDFDPMFDEWRYIIWFWEALAALVLLFVLLKHEKKALRGHQTAVFLTVLGTTQILLVLASLADMASEFVFDKYEYAPWLYLSMPLAAAACSVMLYVWKKKKGIIPALVICAATAALLIAYASRTWDEFELEPVDDMIRFAILYGTMAVDLICIGLAIRLNLAQKTE